MKQQNFLVIIAAVVIFSQSALAVADEIGELKQKVNTVQQENQALQERLKKQEALINELTQRLQALEKKDSSAHLMEGLPQEQHHPSMVVKGFGEVSFKAEKADTRSAADASTFTNGELDFIVTSKISDNATFFNETLIEAEEDETEIDIERLYLKYSLSDGGNVMLGRYHTAMGYWNPMFHHGTWFQTTATRPLLAQFEDDGGILPMHHTGVSFSGWRELEWIDLMYDLGLSNGRDNIVSHMQDVQDKNDAKAINGQLSFKPRGLSGLIFGVNACADKIPALASLSTRNGEIREIILGSYLVYQQDKLEILSEGYNIKHHDEVSGNDYETIGIYGQASYKLKNKYTPYYRFDMLDFGRGDPYFSGIDIDNRKHTIGLRWDMTTWNALKLELSYSDRKNAADIGAITLNDSFHF